MNWLLKKLTQNRLFFLFSLAVYLLVDGLLVLKLSTGLKLKVKQCIKCTQSICVNNSYILPLERYFSPHFRYRLRCVMPSAIYLHNGIHFFFHLRACEGVQLNSFFSREKCVLHFSVCRWSRKKHKREKKNEIFLFVWHSFSLLRRFFAIQCMPAN